MFFKNPNLNIILVLVLIVFVLVFISMQLKTSFKIEGFSGDLINLEKFATTNKSSNNNIQIIKTDVQDIKKELSTGYPDMSKYALKSEIQTSQCRVSNAIDKDNYKSLTEIEKLSKCPVAADFNPSQWVLKSSIINSQKPVDCPVFDTSKYVLKSTLPATLACPDCKCPTVKVSAGLCQKPPPCPACPEPKPCPVLECPAPKACPPQLECPPPPPKEKCPPKICPSCPVIPKPTECPKCCDRDVIKVLKKTVYVDKTGSELNGLNGYDETITDLTSSYGNLDPAPTFGSGLVTPKPIDTIGTSSTSTGGTLEEQSKAGIVNYSTFDKPTEPPFVQSFKINPTNNKTCNPNGFNSEFKQFGIYGNNTNKSMFN
jgi:hypothetical protein